MVYRWINIFLLRVLVFSHDYYSGQIANIADNNNKFTKFVHKGSILDLLLQDILHLNISKSKLTAQQRKSLRSNILEAILTSQS